MMKTQPISVQTVHGIEPPPIEHSDDRYTVRFAATEAELDAALKLRFEIFNLELNEGLEASFINGRDEDRFDRTCLHLIVAENSTGRVVGTYRLRTIEMAGGAFGFYSSGEFTLEDLPYEVLADSVELGRACIAREHRNTRVLFLLWKGVADFISAARKRYAFGCCSLSSQDFTDGSKAMRQLARDGHVHPSLRVSPREEFKPRAADFLTDDDGSDIKIPKLFDTYLRIGALVCGEPLIDRGFKTIDFFIIVDTARLSEKYAGMFFGRSNGNAA
ncbi:MAG: GNAT family N-acetyltransferase [Acidobacteria bacterium]|nr:GNAT family N-acetyltransferase [Acidobacteriota bacterium]